MSFTDRATRISCYIEYIVQATVCNLAPLLFVIFNEEFGLSLEKLAFLITINFGTQMLIDVVTCRLMKKMSPRRLMRLSCVFCFVGFWLMSFLPYVLQDKFCALAISSFVFSAGGAMVDVLVSPIIDSLPSDSASGSMSLLHSFYCWGQVGVTLLTTLLLRLIGRELWFVIPVIYSAIPVYCFFAFSLVPIPERLVENSKKPIGSLFKNKYFFLALLLMTCSGAAEISIGQWSSFFAEKALGVSKTLGDILGPAAFAFCMAVTRMLYSIYSEKLKIEKVLFFCSFLCVGGYLMVALIGDPLVSLIGCSVCGVATSLMWPGVLSMTAEKFKNDGTALFAVLAMAGDLGCVLGPWIVGETAERTLGFFKSTVSEYASLKLGMIVALIFPILMLVFVPIFAKTRKKIQTDESKTF